LRVQARNFDFISESASDVQTVAGSGVRGVIARQAWALGSPKWLGVPTGEFASTVDRFESRGDSVVALYRDALAVAVIALADALDPSTIPALAHLRKLKITPIVASGDNELAVRKVSDQLMIDKYFANSSPAEKLALVTANQNDGHFVAMIGDGINDAAALAKAHLSMAMGTGADVAASAADIVLLRSTMAAAVDAIELSRATMRTIKINLFWAFAYNVAAIPLAMFGLLGPVIASAAMAFSSVFVVTNSLRLRSFKSISN
jgi:Cu+-exporting ATPase